MNTETLDRPETGHGTGGDASQMVLTLTVAGQLCGVRVLAVRDVLGPQTITRIPLAPPEVAGSLNLRGRIVTAIDVRARLGLPDERGSSERLHVIATTDGGLVSLLVDDIADLVEIEQTAFEVAPVTMRVQYRGLVPGVFKTEGPLLLLLDVDELANLG